MRRVFLFPALLVMLIGSVILSQSSVKNPHGQLQWDCQDCHTTESWSNLRDSLNFDHAATGFQLIGAHAAAQCIGCHTDPVFSHVGASCIDCHTDHHGGKLGTECQNCHAPRDWQYRRDALELHSTRGFALTGAHAVADCEACHRGHAQQDYAGTPVDCYDCHAEAYAATDEPNHAQAGFPLECQTCHDASLGSWRYAEFNHPASFPLTQGHGQVACGECHPSGYAGTPIDCYACHSADFASTVNPDHETSGIAHDCTLCHTTAAWQPASYDHATTAFPLTGAHRQTACVACHATGYAGTPADCYACHESDFVSVTDPNHVAQGFSQTCTVCHTTDGWSPSSFNHATTAFPLTGKHVDASCTACHASGYAGTPIDCYSCHQNNFESASDPNHVQAGFSHTCTDCHTTSGWTPSSYSHSTTGFALTGAHTTAACVSCHATQYAGTPSICYACHQTAFEQVTAPNHVTNNFDHDCTGCHSTTAWLPATFDHNATAFPLTGQHVTASCAACHATQYAGTPTTCLACHESAYQATTDPNHAAASFPTTCQTCHTTAAWMPATWDHDAQYFPINSGAHVVATCADCHTNASSYTVFDCTTCHEHNRTDTDSDHTAVNDYQYLSSACYGCHPRGQH